MYWFRDGYSRHILWSRLGEMALIHFNRDETYYRNGLHQKDISILEREDHFQKERDKFLREGTEEEKDLMRYSNDQLYSMIENGAMYASFKRVVRAIVRKNNGLRYTSTPSDPSSWWECSDDEYELEEKEKAGFK